MADSCSNCRFGARFAKVDDRPVPKHIICRRYPAAVEKNAAEWCGEFAPPPVTGPVKK